MKSFIHGWKLEEKFICPPEAYTDGMAWLSSFEAIFPERAKKMHTYSEEQGWTTYVHFKWWSQVVRQWLDDNAESIYYD